MSTHICNRQEGIRSLYLKSTVTISSHEWYGCICMLLLASNRIPATNSNPTECHKQKLKSSSRNISLALLIPCLTVASVKSCLFIMSAFFVWWQCPPHLSLWHDGAFRDMLPSRTHAMVCVSQGSIYPYVWNGRRALQWMSQANSLRSLTFPPLVLLFFDPNTLLTN